MGPLRKEKEMSRGWVEFVRQTKKEGGPPVRWEGMEPWVAGGAGPPVTRWGAQGSQMPSFQVQPLASQFRLHLEKQACGRPSASSGLCWALFPTVCPGSVAFKAYYSADLMPTWGRCYISISTEQEKQCWQSSSPTSGTTVLGIQVVWLPSFFHICRLNLSSSYLGIQGHLSSKPKCL